MRKWTGKRI